MGYLFGTNESFIKGASASGLIFGGSMAPVNPFASQISLPTPGSGMMFGPDDINGNADHITQVNIETPTAMILNPAYINEGLWRIKVAGYMNDDVNYFYNNPRIPDNNYGSSKVIDTFGGFGSQQLPIDETYSLQWTGMFLAPETGNYNFYTISDDCSYLWIGDDAKNGANTIYNALVNNGGAHGAQSVMSNRSVYLEAGKYYNMRIQFGEAGGGESCMVFYSNDGGQTKVTDIRNKTYYDPVNYDLY